MVDTVLHLLAGGLAFVMGMFYHHLRVKRTMNSGPVAIKLVDSFRAVGISGELTTICIREMLKRGIIFGEEK